MTDKLKLEIAIKKAGLTKREVSKRLSLSEMGFYQKINNITEFKASEIDALVNMLAIKDIKKIFFAKIVD